MDYVGTNDLFPSVATDAEKALGFKEAIIAAPNGAYFGEPDRIRVVTLELDEIGSRSRTRATSSAKWRGSRPHEFDRSGPVSIPRFPVIPFKTTSDEILHLAQIVVDMKNAGIAHEFAAHVMELGQSDQGIYDLAAMWRAENDATERDEILADLQDSIDDYLHAPREPEQKPYIHYKDLGAVAAQVVVFKKKLRDIIDKNGGVSHVAKLTGIPQQSLSRMLNSPSMPRRTTCIRSPTLSISLRATSSPTGRDRS